VGGEGQCDEQVTAIASSFSGGDLQMILCVRRAWENGWESWVGGNDAVVCSWVGEIGEHLNMF
jgi:hypothetical protein